MKKFGFNKILICLMIIITMFTFTGCGNKDNDDKLTTTTNDELGNSEITPADLFKEKEFSKALTAITYANKIISTYSYKAEGTGKIETTGGGITEEIFTKTYVSRELQKFMNDIEVINTSNSKINLNMGILFELLEGRLLYCESDETEKNRIVYKPQNVYYKVYEGSQLKEFKEDFCFAPGDNYIDINSKTIASTLVEITKKSEDYYIKIKLNNKAFEKFLTYIKNNNVDVNVKIKDCIVEILLDKYSRYKQISYEVSADVDATAIEGINAKLSGKIKLTENYSNYNDFADFTPRLVWKKNK